MLQAPCCISPKHSKVDHPEARVQLTIRILAGMALLSHTSPTFAQHRLPEPTIHYKMARTRQITTKSYKRATRSRLSTKRLPFMKTDLNG